MRFYNKAEMVQLYKSHVPVLEFFIPAVFHAANSLLELLDKVQDRFLREVGLTDEEALVGYNLAPLRSRRDMAGLGLIHRTVLGCGAEHFEKWFYLSGRQPAYNTRLQERRHNKQLYEYREGKQTELLKRSLLG